MCAICCLEKPTSRAPRAACRPGALPPRPRAPTTHSASPCIHCSLPSLLSKVRSRAAAFPGAQAGSRAIEAPPGTSGCLQAISPRWQVIGWGARAARARASRSGPSHGRATHRPPSGLVPHHRRRNRPCSSLPARGGQRQARDVGRERQRQRGADLLQGQGARLHVQPPPRLQPAGRRLPQAHVGRHQPRKRRGDAALRRHAHRAHPAKRRDHSHHGRLLHGARRGLGALACCLYARSCSPRLAASLSGQQAAQQRVSLACAAATLALPLSRLLPRPPPQPPAAATAARRRRRSTR